jgi:hypothetical protein
MKRGTYVFSDPDVPAYRWLLCPCISEQLPEIPDFPMIRTNAVRFHGDFTQGFVYHRRCNRLFHLRRDMGDVFVITPMKNIMAPCWPDGADETYIFEGEL